MAVMAKPAFITGSTPRARSAEEKSILARRLDKVVWPWIEQGKLRPKLHPLINSAFPLAGAVQAHERMEAGSHVGKVVLVTDARE